MNLDFDEMLEYVYKILKKNDGLKSHKPQLYFRNRFEHIKRVYGWTKRIVKGVEACNCEIVYTAAIFHDCGYSKEASVSHAKSGAEIFLDFANMHHYPQKFNEIVYQMILNHSNKGLLRQKETPIEMIILLEADLIDEEGALGLVFDLLAEGYKLPSSYDQVLNEIMIHSAHILQQDYMITPVAKKIWQEKKALIQCFLEQLEKDLFLMEV